MKHTKNQPMQNQFLLLALFALLLLPFSIAAQDNLKLEPQEKFLKTEDAVPNRYIVVFDEQDQVVRNTESSEQIAVLANGLAAAYNGAVTRVYSSALKGFAVELSEAEAVALSKDARVKYVTEDGMAYPSATQFNAPYGLDRIDQRDRPLDTTYNYAATGAGVRAYVIDSGILPTHNEFGGRAVAGADFVGGNGIDCNGHGTHVAGTIAGATYGVAKQARIVGVRVFNCTGGSSWSTIIAGVDWVRTNRVLPAVANMSLGGGANQAVDDAVRNLIRSGVTVAIAAGNSSADANGFSPARVREAITVGASNINDARAGFSNFGTALDLFAPGENIISAWYTSNTATNTISGTSMATPHVAGVATLYLQANPGAAPATVGNAIVSTATPNRLSNIGPGSPNLLLYSLLNRGGYGGDVHFLSYGNGMYDWQGAGCYDIAQPTNPAANRFKFQIEAVPFAPNPGTTVAQRAAFTFPETNRPYSVILSRTAPYFQLRAPLGGGSADTTVSIVGNPNQAATIYFREIGGAQRLLGTIVVRTHSNSIVEYSADTAQGTNLRAFIYPNVVVDGTVQPGRYLTELRGMAGALPLQQFLYARNGQAYTVETLRNDAAARSNFSMSWGCQAGQSLFQAPAPATEEQYVSTTFADGSRNNAFDDAAAEAACEEAGVPRFDAERFAACVFDVINGGDELGREMAIQAGFVYTLGNEASPDPGPDPCVKSETPVENRASLRSFSSRATFDEAVICHADETVINSFSATPLAKELPLLNPNSSLIENDSARGSLKKR